MILITANGIALQMNGAEIFNTVEKTILEIIW